MRGSVEVRLRELLEELVETEKASPDPFKIRVREILEELSELLPYASIEELPLDAEVLLRLAEVVKRQEEWVRGEASTLALGKFIAMLKVKLLGERELALQLLESWRPIVELEQVTFTEIMRAVDYLGSKRKLVLDVEGSGMAGTISIEEMAAMGLLSEYQLDKLLDRVRDKLRSLLSTREMVEYWEVVKGVDRYETYLNAYALSYLATLGEIDILYDPLEGEYYVAKRSSGEGESMSMIVPLKPVERDAN